MKKKIIIIASIVVFVLIALTAVGLYSFQVRQEYQYIVTYKPTEESKKIIHILQKKMKEAGYSRLKHKYLLGTQKSFSFGGAHLIENCDRFCFIYGYTCSYWSVPEQKKEFRKICNEVIDPAVSKLEGVSKHGKDRIVYLEGKRYKIFWCINFD